MYKGNEMLNRVVEVVSSRLGLEEAYFPFVEYREPLDFNIREVEGADNAFSAQMLFESANAVDCSDSLFESVEDMMTELEEGIGSEPLSAVVSELKTRFDLICVRKF